MNRAVFIVLAVALVGGVLTLVTFFGTKPPPQSTFRIKLDEETILFGVTPWGETRRTKEAYQPLLNFLGGRIGKKFQVLAIEDYDAAIDNIVEGDIDIAVLPPVSLVVAKRREPALQYISTLLRQKGQNRFATYKGYIVALRSRYAGRTFDDFIRVPGQYRFGFVTKKSSSGWAYPMAMMKRRAIDPEKVFREVKVFENHPAVTDAVVEGKVDLGATWEYNLEEAVKRHGDLFSIVYETPGIPGLAWVASKRLDPSLIQKIRAVQKEISDSGEYCRRLLGETPDKGWEVLDESFYDGVREVVNYVGIFE